MLRGRSAVAFVSSVSSGAASSRCLLRLRRRLSSLFSLRGWTATTACSPARPRASWTDSSRSSMPQRGSFATGGSMTTSHRSSAIFSTGCQSHSAFRTSSVYSSSYHFTERLQSTCAIAKYVTLEGEETREGVTIYGRDCGRLRPHVTCHTFNFFHTYET